MLQNAQQLLMKEGVRCWSLCSANSTPCSNLYKDCTGKPWRGTTRIWGC